MKISVSRCYFQREQNSEREEGLIIDEDKLIIDKNGRVVEAPVWHYTLMQCEGHIIFDLG